MYNFKNLRKNINSIATNPQIINREYSTSYTVQEGICYGLSCMYLQAFFFGLKGLESFYHRLHIITEESWTLQGKVYHNLSDVIIQAQENIAFPLPTETEFYINLKVFLQNLFLYQARIKFFNRQQDILKASRYLLPTTHYAEGLFLSTEQGFVELYNKATNVNQQELQKWLNLVICAFKKKTSPTFKYGFLISNLGHVIAIGITQEGTTFFDQNQNVECKSFPLSDIAEYIFKAFEKFETLDDDKRLNIHFQACSTPREIQQHWQTPVFNNALHYDLNVLLSYIKNSSFVDPLFLQTPPKPILPFLIKQHRELNKFLDTCIFEGNPSTWNIEKIFEAKNKINHFFELLVNYKPIDNSLLDQILPNNVHLSLVNDSHYSSLLNRQKIMAINHPENNNKAFFMAIKTNDIHFVEYLIHSRVDITKLSIKKANGIYFIISLDSKEILELLLIRGIIHTDYRLFDETLLNLAIKANSIGCVKVLLDYGANLTINYKGEALFFGITPLNLAIKEGHLEIAKLIRAKLADGSRYFAGTF